jgi:hypothetical protein
MLNSKYPTSSIMGAQWEYNRCMLHAERMDAATHHNRGNAFTRMKAAQWRDKVLEEACHWDKLINK